MLSCIDQSKIFMGGGQVRIGQGHVAKGISPRAVAKGMLL